MNILLVCNKFPYPPKDGGQIATFSLIRGFAEQGANVTVAAINTKKHFFDTTKLPDSIRRIADFRTIFRNTDIHIKETLLNLLFSRQPYTATRFFFKEFAELLQSILQEKQFDVVQLEGLYLCSYIPLIRQYSHAHIAYRAHNVEYEIWERVAKAEKNILKRWYLKNLTKRIKRYEFSILNTYDSILPITQRDANAYNTMGNNKHSHVVSTGIFINDLKDIHSQQPLNHISLFHLGALDWTPNQQGLLWFIDNCWAKLHNLCPELQLFVAGRNAPQWFIDKINIAGIVYVGEVDNAYEFMQQHTIMIVPLLAGGGMRIKILEGLAYKKVIVSTPIGAEGIEAQNGKEIIIAKNAEEFISCIYALCKHENNILSIGKNAQQFIYNNFDNKLIVNNLITFYKDEIH